MNGLREGVAAEPYGDPDGLSVVRSVRVEGEETAKWLDRLLTLVGDKRVAEHHVTDAGNLIVNLVGGSDSESRDPFMLSVAADALEDQSNLLLEGPDLEPKVTAKKATAKRAAKRAPAKKTAE
jgi:hypothetical protein